MALLTNLQAYYQFQNNSNDVTGNGNNGTDTNITYGTGVIGQAAISNGTTSRIAVGTGLSNTGDMTVAGWINSSSFADHQFIAAKSVTGNPSDTQWAFYIQASTGKLSFWNGSIEKPTGAVITTGSFQHVAFVVASGVLTGYVNASASGTTQSVSYGSGGSTITAQLCNRDSADNTQVVNGSLDELGIWGRALSGAEITQLYNSGAGLTYPFSSDSDQGIYGATTNPSKKFYQPARMIVVK